MNSTPLRAATTSAVSVDGPAPSIVHPVIARRNDLWDIETSMGTPSLDRNATRPQHRHRGLRGAAQKEAHAGVDDEAVRVDPRCDQRGESIVEEALDVPDDVMRRHTGIARRPSPANSAMHDDKLAAVGRQLLV
jgi:hypothetical protein